MRGILSTISCCFLVLACSSGVPTPSPAPTGSSSPTQTTGSSPTPPPSPSISLGPDGFPTSVLGLPVLTVAAAQALADNGDADGRFMAVGGYWYSFALPCAYQPHVAPLADHCGYGVITDEQQSNPNALSGGFSPALLTESAASFGEAGGETGNGSRIVAIVHVADYRLWQCAADARADCKTRPAFDRLVWANGLEVDPAQFQPALTTAMTLDEATSAASAAADGGQVVLAYPLDATTLNDVDPRFIGRATGTVWFARVITGAADAKGTAEGTDVLLADSSGSVIATMSQTVDLSAQPARVVLDVKPPDGSDAQFGFSITVSIPTVVAGSLDSSSTPIVLTPSGYSVHAIVVSGTVPPPGPPCDLPLRVDAGADVSYYADFSGASRCTWKQGEWPFN